MAFDQVKQEILTKLELVESRFLFPQEDDAIQKLIKIVTPCTTFIKQEVLSESLTSDEVFFIMRAMRRSNIVIPIHQLVAEKEEDEDIGISGETTQPDEATVSSI